MVCRNNTVCHREVCILNSPWNRKGKGSAPQRRALRENQETQTKFPENQMQSASSYPVSVMIST